MNGKFSTSPSPSDFMRKITSANEVRKISGVVNARRALKSSSLYKRIAMPALTRPQRPERCLADAWEIGSICNKFILLRGE